MLNMGAHSDAFALHVNHQQGDPLVLFCPGIGPDGQPMVVRHMGMGVECLLSVNDEMVAPVLCGHLQAHQVWSGPGLRISQGEFDLAFCDGNQKFLFGLFIAMPHDTGAAQKGAGKKKGQAGIGQLVFQDVDGHFRQLQPPVLFGPWGCQPPVYGKLFKKLPGQRAPVDIFQVVGFRYQLRWGFLSDKLPDIIGQFLFFSGKLKIHLSISLFGLKLMNETSLQDPATRLNQDTTPPLGGSLTDLNCSGSIASRIFWTSSSDTVSTIGLIIRLIRGPIIPSAWKPISADILVLSPPLSGFNTTLPPPLTGSLTPVISKATRSFSTHSVILFWNLVSREKEPNSPRIIQIEFFSSIFSWDS